MLFHRVVPFAFTNLPDMCAGNLKLVDLVIKFLDPFGVRQALLIISFKVFISNCC